MLVSFAHLARVGEGPGLARPLGRRELARREVPVRQRVETRLRESPSARSDSPDSRRAPHRSQTISGVPTLPIRVLSASWVATTFSAPALSATSQTQPEPNWSTPPVTKASFSLSRPPKAAPMALSQLAGRRGFLRGHAVPEEGVVPGLGGVVVELLRASCRRRRPTTVSRVSNDWPEVSSRVLRVLM